MKIKTKKTEYKLTDVGNGNVKITGPKGGKPKCIKCGKRYAHKNFNLECFSCALGM